MYFIILHFRKNHEILKTGRIYTIWCHLRFFLRTSQFNLQFSGMFV